MQNLLSSIFMTLCLVLHTTAFAQVPTAAQMEAFRNLPADQQKAVLESMNGARSTDGTTRRDPPLSTPVTMASVPEAQKASGPARIGKRATVILDVSVVDELLDEGRSVASARQERITAGNPYRLDDEGHLLLPSLPAMTLSGLTEDQAAQLLNADPRLAGLRFKVTLLPVANTGIDGLRRFGYDLFDQIPTTFAPATDIPVPSDYRLGPGDNVTVELFGKKTGRYQLVVDRTGVLTIPDFGPINVTSLTFDQVRFEIEQRVASQMIGVRASITMGQLRSIRIFVLGDVVRPGSYTISALSNITNALFSSGGITTIGSLRDISLKRAGRHIASFDLYDLLLRGDTSRDIALEQGDAIFIPPVGSTAGIGGRVRRPAIYEFRSGETIGGLLELSGGLAADADPRRATLERINPNHQRIVLNVDLSVGSDRATKLLPGDVLTVPRVSDDTRAVILEGHVQQPGPRAWREGMRLTELLGSLETMKLNADLRYLLVRREHMPDRRVEVLSADATQAFSNPGSASDPVLTSGDRIMVFSRQADRGPAFANVLKELRSQVRDNQPAPIVQIRGRVRAPGEYPLEHHMTVRDLIRAGGGLDDAAFTGSAELTRYEVVNNEARKTEFIELTRADLHSDGNGASMPLRPYDVLVIKEMPEWGDQESVTVSGEVRFPGTYPIRRGDTLSSVVQRAGGLTTSAFPPGSVFIRSEIKEQEQQQLRRLAERLQSDLIGVSQEQSPEAFSAGQSLLSELRNAKPTGRLVINLSDALSRTQSDDDIELRDGDRLVVPRIKQYVTVIGEVQNPASQVWRSDTSLDDYIDLSGGVTRRADTKRVYVVRADGSVAPRKTGRWFSSSDLKPGDTIVVPVAPENTRTLPVLQSVTTVLYNIAIAVAAVGSL